MTLQIAPQRIPSVRGLVPLHNRYGKPYSVTDVHRWLRLNRVVFKCQKVDLLWQVGAWPPLEEILAYARGLDLPVSLRTACHQPPPAELSELKFFDVLLCPEVAETQHFQQWLHAAREVGLPVRVQLPIPSSFTHFNGNFGQELQAAGVVAVTLTTYDPFAQGSAPAADSNAALDELWRFVEELRELHLEVNVLGLPPSTAPDSFRCHIVAPDRFSYDHQQYQSQAYRLAINLYPRSTYIASKIIMAMLARYTSAPSPVDKLLLEWLFIKHRFVYFWILFFRKFARDWRRPLGPPRPLRDTARASVDELSALRGDWVEEEMKRMYARLFPNASGKRPAARENSDWSPSSEWANQPKYYDAIDAQRANATASQRALAETAQQITSNRPPDKTMEASAYAAYQTFHEPLSNAVRWMSISNVEQVSSGIQILSEGFTAAVSFGGGLAQYIGFAFGRHCRILCPMVELNHRLILHVAQDGAFVLLRDGILMQPVEFEGQYYVPTKLLFPKELQLCLWNIDDHVSTQNVDFWYGDHSGIAPRDAVKYSIVIFSTRFSRRLQFAIQSVMNQRGVEHGEVEVIVGYVPGLDTTDDVLDSLAIAYPAAPILRMAFPEQFAKSKGFVLNECMRAARGEWIAILDSDILLPPDALAHLSAAADGATFLAPRGRCMLDRETTAKILLGEITPWEKWDALRAASRDNREGEAEGIPIGYCQIFRSECLDRVLYPEYDHFEGADSEFGLEMRRAFGPEKRLDFTVLHLDHGGSQWFGAYKHQ